MKSNTAYRNFVAIMLILSLLGAMTSLASPVLMDYWGNHQIGFDGSKILVLLAVMVAGMLVTLLFVIFRENFAYRYNCDNMEQLLRTFINCEYDYLKSSGAAALLQRCQQAVDNVYMYMTGGIIKICTGVIIIAVTLLIVGRQSIVLALLLVAMLPFNYFGYRMLNKELARRSEVLQTESAAGYQILLSYLEQTDYIKQSAEHNEMINQMRPAVSRLYRSMADINIFAQGGSAFLSNINLIIRTVIMVLIAMNHLSTGGSTVNVVMLTILLPMYFAQISEITNANLDRQNLDVSQKFMQELRDHGEKNGAKEIDAIHRVSLHVDGLKIGDQVLAESIDGDYVSGDVVRIKGESGKGKSTLAKKMMKFRTSDGIFYNNTEAININNQELRTRVTYLPQEAPIIKGTLRENLFLNRKEDQETEAFFQNEPLLAPIYKTHGLDDEIEEGGANLSGGEKQRIAVARTLLDNPDVLILDEITSNIDADSSEAVMRRLMEQYKDKIIFVISHDDMVDNYTNKTLQL